MLNSQALKSEEEREADLTLSRRDAAAALVYPVLHLVASLTSDIGVRAPFATWTTLALLIALSAFLIWHCRRFPGVDHPDRKIWKTRFFWAILASAATWSCFAATALAFNERELPILVLLETAGIAAGANTSLAPDFRLLRLYLIVLLLPSVVLSLVLGVPQSSITT